MTHIINGSEIVREQTLEKLKLEAGDPASLDNLNLKIMQESPVCEIEIQIGPGRMTSVSVEAEDHTWAIGRHTEIMESFTKTRAKWAFGADRIPQWPKRRSISPGQAAVTFVKNAGNWGGALLSLLLFLVIFGFIIGPPSVIAFSLSHHRAIPHATMIRLPFTAACIAIVTVMSCRIATVSKSKIIVRDKSFWTSNRTAMIASIAAVLSAFAGIVSLFTK